MPKSKVKTHTRRTAAGRLVRVRQYLRTKSGEEAPGLPSRKDYASLPNVEKPQHWGFVLHKHHAKKRGLHYDFRLGRGGSAYSWTLSGPWPTPGKFTYVIEQPTHTQTYMKAEGEIPTGYGAGTVKIDRGGSAIVHGADKDKVTFTIIDGRKTEDYSIVRMGGHMWKLINMGLTAPHMISHQHKPTYLHQKPEKLDPNKSDTVWSAKIDGAHGIAILQGNKRPRVFSYRKPKSGEAYIEWTHKMPGLYNKRVPGSFGDSVFRVEVYGKKDGKPLEVNRVAAMLNSNTLKSREMQKHEGKLRGALIDVIRWKGKDVSNATGAEKLRIMAQVSERFPYFELPDTATTPANKASLLESIRSGKHHQTTEGIVQVPLKGTRYTKSPFRKMHDVYVRGFFDTKPGSQFEGKGVGGFEYSWTRDGPIVGRVGTGFSHELRAAMMRNPKKFIGRVARVEGMKYKSGTGRALSFKDWHPDKGQVGGYEAEELVPVEKTAKG